MDNKFRCHSIDGEPNNKAMDDLHQDIRMILISDEALSLDKTNGRLCSVLENYLKLICPV
jgi:hypothetical protein